MLQSANMSLSANLQTNGPLHQKMRFYKDKFFAPFVSICNKLKITPDIATGIGLVIGAISIGLLFINYWYFVIVMAISIFMDGVDGALARGNNAVSKFGKKFDYYTDLILVISMYSALIIWLEEPIWVIGLNIVGIVFLLNILLKKPIDILSGRISTFVPLVFGLVKLSLIVLPGYSLIMLISLIKKKFFTK